jgi:hypothetical protein
MALDQMLRMVSLSVVGRSLFDSRCKDSPKVVTSVDSIFNIH